MVSRLTPELKPLKLDLKDKKILSLLVQNSRLTFSEIAKKVQLSRDAIRYRMANMEKQGLIQNYTVTLNDKFFGQKKYRVYLQLEELKTEEAKELYKYLTEQPEVLMLMHYTDKLELELVIQASDAEDFDSIMNRIFSKHKKTIIDMEIVETVKEFTFNFLPEKYLELSKVKIFTPGDTLQKLDLLDRKLLKLLLKDSRESLVDLAQKLKVSADTINYRIKKLKEAGIIKSFTTIVNYSLLGYNYFCLFFTLKYFTQEADNKFKEITSKHKQIISAYKTIGEWNLLVKIIAKTPIEFHQIVKHLRTDFKGMVNNYDTLLGYREHCIRTFNPEVL
jgi:Lrp/AsnC family transcriptional regulator, leucine-responsive regulatory protein